MAAKETNDFVLLASFLTNAQNEKQNKNIKLLHEIVQGNRNASELTKDIELSSTELKELQLSNIKQLWAETTYPTQDVSHMIKLHAAYIKEAYELENKRLYEQAGHIQYAKSLDPRKTAENMGLCTSRRPVPKLPPTHHKSQNVATYGVDP